MMALSCILYDAGLEQVYSLPAMERLQCIPTETPINYTAMSPDMQSLAAVGDTPQLWALLPSLCTQCPQTSSR
jgi:hypothetical protein